MDNMQFEKPPVENVIPLKQAQEWTANWRKWVADQGVTPEDTLKGFMVPFKDIQNLSNFPVENLLGVRVYLCLATPDDFSSIRVVLVPVDKDQKDIVAYPKTMGSDDDEDSAIFDLTMPCPHFCDKGSPLV